MFRGFAWVGLGWVGLGEKGSDLLGVRELAIGDMSCAACFEDVLAAFNASEKDRLAAGIYRPFLLASVFAVEAVVTDNTQGGLVVNAGQFGLDAGWELSGCCHTFFVRMVL